MMPCSLVDGCKCFGGTCFFSGEDGSNRFLREVNTNIPNYTVSHSRTLISIFIAVRTLDLTNFSFYLLQIYYYQHDDKFIPVTRFQEVKYLDLDLEWDAASVTSSTTQIPKSPERVQSTSTVYKTVDFVKTEAFNRTRQEVEEERKQCSAADL
jgi:hypothetical protein